MSTNVSGINLMALSWDDCHAISCYSELQHELKAVQAQLAAIQPVVDQIIAGLPKHIRVMTVTQFSSYDKHPPTKVFHCKNGEWSEHGRVVTAGASKEFYGDGGFIDSDGLLVIIDSEAGVGISVGDKTVKFVDLNNDPHERTLGGSSLERHRYTLALLADVKPGEVTYFDCMW